MKHLLLACLMGVALTAPAYAQSTAPVLADVQGPYIGLGVTTSRNAFADGTKGALKLFGGYDFNRTFGVEAAYINQAHFDSSIVVSGDTTYLYAPTTMRTRSGYLAGKATLPVSDRLSIVTKLGVAVNRGETTISENANIHHFYARSTKYGLYAGIGIKYQLTDKVALSLELERVGRMTDGRHEPEAASLNASYSF